jgi:GTP-binding protein
MVKYSFNTCRFLLSATKPSDYPKQDFPLLVFAGRSNVGKSSLINHLFSEKLAFVSTVPGKTDLINYFLIDNNLFLVDLPGYGFAAKSKQEQSNWNKWIEEFVEENMSKILFTVLIDSRHNPFPADIELLAYLKSRGKKPLVVFTKTDKLKGKEKAKLKDLPEYLQGCKTLLYSTKDYVGKKILIKTLKEILSDGIY